MSTGSRSRSPAFTCPTCGSCKIPASHIRARSEYEALGPKGKAVARELIGYLHLHGVPDDRPWNDALWSCLRELVPSYSDAHDVGEPARTMGIIEEAP